MRTPHGHASPSTRRSAVDAEHKLIVAFDYNGATTTSHISNSILVADTGYSNAA